MMIYFLRTTYEGNNFFLEILLIFTLCECRNRYTQVSLRNVSILSNLSVVIIER